jgi:hypothetical protein
MNGRKNIIVLIGWISGFMLNVLKSHRVLHTVFRQAHLDETWPVVGSVSQSRVVMMPDFPCSVLLQRGLLRNIQSLSIPTPHTHTHTHKTNCRA